MGSNARTRSAMFMSLLDLVSCALGASVILAVVFSIIETPIPTPKTLDFISAEFSANGKVKLGLMIYHEQSNDFVLLTPEPKQHELAKHKVSDLKLAGFISWYTYKTADGNRSITSLYLDQPAIGDWLIAPYIYGYDDNFTKQFVDKISVKWRHKNAQSDILCEQGVDSDAWWNFEKLQGTESGGLVKGVNINVQTDEENCIRDKAYIIHHFAP